MADKDESKPADKPKPTKEAARGAWAVVDDGGQVLVVESSEIKAFRAAQPFRARVVMWPFGSNVADVILPLITPEVKP